MNAAAALGVLVAFVACAALTPLIRKLCLRFEFVDRPGPLKIHTRPIPRLGGIAIAISIVAGLFVIDYRDLRSDAYFLVALGLLWIAGLADDLRGLSPYARLAVQIMSGLLLWLGGWRFQPGDFFPHDGILSACMVFGLVVLLANSFNLLDGSDGLASGVAAIAGASYLIISSRFAVVPLKSAVAASLAASSTAFLLGNYPPASIYLGDSGSTLLGFCVAFLALDSRHIHNSPVDVSLSALLVAGIPLVDTVLAVLRRIKRREAILEGDREHLYDVMLVRGWSARRVALTIYSVTLALAVLAWAGVQRGLRAFEIVLALSFAGILVAGAWLGSLGLRRTNTAFHHPESFTANVGSGPAVNFRR